MEQAKTKTEKKEKLSEADVQFYSSILDFNMNLDDMIVSKANMLLGISIIMMTILLNGLFNSGLKVDQPALLLAELVLLTGGFLSTTITMFIVLPKVFRIPPKERIKEDIIYHKNITKFYTREEFTQLLKSIRNNPDAVAEAYSHQIYSLASKVIPYKNKLLKISGLILVYSLMICAILIMLNIIIV